jgi:phosphonate transport system ATP-binding protein
VGVAQGGGLQPFFQLRDVGVHYGTEAALSGVSLGLEPGEQAAVVGPSGGGKSTLLRVMSAGVWPSGGEVLLRGEAVAELGSGRLRELRAEVGMIHQQLGLVPNLRVAANLAMGRLGKVSLAGGLREVFWPSKAELREMTELLGRVGLAEKLHARVDHLSGGQQQRVAIARALWQRPQAMLADEPVSSLDPARAKAMLALLTKLCREDRLALLVSLHQLELARAFFPRLIGLRGGKVVFDRPSAEVGEAEFAALYQLPEEEL